MKGSPDNSKILCVNQINRDLKKSQKQQFYLRTPSRCKYNPNIFCYNIFNKYLEPDLLGNIQLVPQLPLGGHCNLSEIIKTQENVKGESNM